MSVDRETDDEPDRLPGAPHPRERVVLFGHDEAERAFLAATAAGRLPHAWLIGGPEGVGKATLAYRVARFLLAHPDPQRAPASLAVDPAHPAARRVAAGAHPDLAVLKPGLRKDGKGFSDQIAVEDARRTLDLFASHPSAGGYRICIVDAADQFNRSSANALLKLIEEPPSLSLFLIVAHAPQRVLPTIRSRCRKLMLRPLADTALSAAVRSLPAPWAKVSDGDLAAASSMADGSVRRALIAVDGERMTAVHETRRLLDALPRLDLKRVLALAESLHKRGADEAYELSLEAVSRWASDRLNARAGEGASRLAPLVEACDKVARAAREAAIYNLDRRPLILSMFGDLADAVRRAA